MERKDRENRSHLRTLSKTLAMAGFSVKDHSDHHGDPYIFVSKPVDGDPLMENLSFGGIRIYTRGKDVMSFRPQNKETAEPFGPAYLLDIEGMYKDLIKDGPEEKIAVDLVRYVVEEVLNYFVYAAKAQSEDEAEMDDDDMLGKVVDGSTGSGTDYSSQVSGDLRRNQTN